MKYLTILLLAVILFACKKNEVEVIVEEPTVVEEEKPPSTEYLISVRDVKFFKVGSQPINQPVNHGLELCNEHFSENSAAGQEMNKTIEEINSIKGSKLSFNIIRNPHKNNFDLFPENPTNSIFDYVNVNEERPMKCGLANDLSFAMRTCRHDKSNGGVNHFTIVAKSSNYKHFKNASSSDFPKKHGLLHEFGHAFGMNHTPDWHEQDQKYISVMQGNLTHLSPLDVAYLRDLYPKASEEHRNYVVSSLTRFNGKKGTFGEENPKAFYIDEEGYLKDKATDQYPKFFAAWFNTGNIDGATEEYGVNQFFLREKASGKTIEIKTWKVAAMPFLSQDQWKGLVKVKVKNPSSIDFQKDWELVFKVNADGKLDESTADDNEITKDVSFKK